MADFVDANFFQASTLEGARRSIKFQGIVDFDEVLKHEGEDIDKQGSRQAYYAVAFGRKTGIYNTWQYVYSQIRRYLLIMSREARAEIEDYSFPCYKRLDTLRKAEGFLEDWNHAYADSWRWTIKNRLSAGWVASELGTDIDSVLFKIKLEVRSPHKPQSANDRVLSDLGKIEEEQTSLTIQPAARPGLQSTTRILDAITHRQAEINAKEAKLVKGLNDPKALKGKTEDAVEVNFTANEELKDKLRGVEEENGLRLESLGVNKNDINERAEQISRLKSELKNLQASHFRETEKAAQLSRDITLFQEVLKEKEKMIDKMRAAGSDLKMLLSEEQKKNAELEKERKVFHEEGQKTLAQLRKLESFAVRGAEADEDIM